ncbi:hypothetical protein M433DRAFT_150891 [Acidomyces richmondensis BFW]|nr:MAG: hypothetical protein FE78DRAFT_84140 [Acidomyces sp. 'richmondensis']KYG48624.1 hypothetical protein M433DRAFT_150891 [Acidomyces richmondensis BFW]
MRTETSTSSRGGVVNPMQYAISIYNQSDICTNTVAKVLGNTKDSPRQQHKRGNRGVYDRAVSAPLAVSRLALDHDRFWGYRFHIGTSALRCYPTHAAKPNAGRDDGQTARISHSPHMDIWGALTDGVIVVGTDSKIGAIWNIGRYDPDGSFDKRILSMVGS